MVVGIDVCKDVFNTGMVVVGFVVSMNFRIIRYIKNYFNMFFNYYLWFN